MIDLAFTAGDTNHLAFDLSFELVRVEIEGWAFVQTREQKIGMFGYLEGYRSGLCLNPYEFVIFVYPDYESNVLITRFIFMMGIWPNWGMFSWMKCTRSWLSRLWMLRSCVWERSRSWLSRLRMMRSCVWEWRWS